MAHKNHNLSFGFGYRRMQNNVLSYASSRGSFTFGGAMTEGIDCGGTQGQIIASPVCSGTKVANTGYDLADFLLGFAGVTSLRTGNDNNYFRGWALNASAMDDWRVNRGLTINVGVRYEYFAPYTELYGHLANIDVNSTFTAIDVVTAAAPARASAVGTYFGAYPASLVKGDPHAFSPRLGLAWRPSQKNNRLVRLGYSIFYSGSSYSSFASQMAAQPPFANNINDTGTLLSPLPLQNGFLPQAVNNQYSINPNYKLGYTQTWTVALQQTLPHNLLMELEYVGIKGTGLPLTILPNQPTIPADNNAPLRIPNASSFTYQTDIGNSIMHAAQVRLDAPVHARTLGGRALHLLEIDRRSQQSGAGPVQPESGARAFFQRPAPSPEPQLRGLLARRCARTVAQRRLEDAHVLGLDHLRRLHLRHRHAAHARQSPASPPVRSFICGPTLPASPCTRPRIRSSIWLPSPPPRPSDEYGDAGRNIITGVPTLELECAAQSRLALRREPQADSTFVPHQQRSEPRLLHQLRYGGRVEFVWTAHVAIRHPDGDVQPSVQLLRAYAKDLDSRSRSADRHGAAEAARASAVHAL